MSEHSPQFIAPQPVKLLNDHEFVGPHRDNADDIEDVISYLEDYVTPGITEMEKTSEDQQQLHDIKDSWLRFGRDLGVDLAERIPDNKRIHYLDAEQLEAFRIARGLRGNFGGGTLDSGEIISSGESDIVVKLGTVSHEIGHIVAHNPNRITEDITAGDEEPTDQVPVAAESRQLALTQSRTGYQVNSTKAFAMINEIITEKMHQVVRDRYWPQYDSLRDHMQVDEDHISYVDAMPMGEALVAKVADYTLQTPDEIWNGLMRGALTGDMKALQPLLDTFGRDGMETLVRYKENVPHQLRRTVRQLGL
jgi:hypothetical protein